MKVDSCARTPTVANVGASAAGGRGGCGTVIIRLKSPAFSGSAYFLR